MQTCDSASCWIGDIHRKHAAVPALDLPTPPFVWGEPMAGMHAPPNAGSGGRLHTCCARLRDLESPTASTSAPARNITTLTAAPARPGPARTVSATHRPVTNNRWTWRAHLNGRCLAFDYGIVPCCASACCHNGLCCDDGEPHGWCAHSGSCAPLGSGQHSLGSHTRQQ